MPDLYADLHVHSTASDGTDDPSALPRIMVRARVGVAALTDHDTVEGLMSFLEACSLAGVVGVPGIEVSARCDTGHLHIVILGFEPWDPHISGLGRSMGDARRRRNIELLRKVQGMGVDLSWEQVAAEAGGQTVGRPHFVNALVNGGWVRTRNEAWDMYVGDRAPAFVEQDKPAPEEVFDKAHRAGAVAIAAHPISAVGRDATKLIPYLETLRDMGLDGVEAYHSSQSQEVADLLLRWTAQRRLFCSGGSDYHGQNRPNVTLGRWGRRRMPVTPLVPLLERLEVADAIAVSIRESAEG